jgi:3'-5' exoribonuclease
MRRFVDQLRDGDAFDDVFLAADKQLRVNRKGQPFIQLSLRDRSGGLSARLWNAGEAIFRSFENGDFVQAEGKVQLFEGSLQIILSHLERTEAEKVELADFLPRAERESGVMLEKLRGLLLSMAHPALRAIAEAFLMDDAFVRAFCQCPAGVKLHHAYIGGLLEHTLTMCEIAERLVPFYPGVDRDLLLMGIFLHDAGKTRELSYGRAFGYSVEGQLLGHIAIAIEMLNEMARAAQTLLGEAIPPDILLRLKHMILSHHGTHEYGSPRVPMTPEAMLLHEIDTLDTRMHMALRELREDRNSPSAWTAYNPTLGRRFYKGGGNGDLFGEGGSAYD